MAENTTLVGLGQMVDLALNFEEGILNFQVLHSLLHIMLQQMEMNDVGVEFRGPEAEHVQNVISKAKPKKTVFPRYSIVGGPTKGKKKHSGGTASGGAPTGHPKKQVSLQDVIKEQTLEEIKEKELRVIERRKDSKEDPELNPLPLKSPPGSQLGITAGDVQTVVVVESQSNLPQFSVAVTKAAFEEVQKDIDVMKTDIKELKELPGNMGLLEAARTQSGPIVDMFQILNLTKRVDATETAIEKIGSLIEDLVKTDQGSPAITEKLQDLKERTESGSLHKARSSMIKLDQRLTDLEKTVENIAANIDTTAAAAVAGKPASPAASAAKMDVDEIPEKDKPSDIVSGSVKDSVKDSVEKASLPPIQEEGASSTKLRKPSSASSGVMILAPQSPMPVVVENVNLETVDMSDALALVQEELQSLKRWMKDSLQQVDDIRDMILSGVGIGVGTGTGTGTVGGGSIDINTEVIDSKFREFTKQMTEMNHLYNNQIGMLNEKFTTVQQDMSDIFTKLEVILPGGDSPGVTAETTIDLANKLSILEKELISISDQAAQLQKEKEEHDKQTNEILEQIDVLKIVKANREDLEDALGDKADACMINRKVSHDQFDAACDDLSRGIEEALSKLEEQEDMWRQALDSIQREVGNKLDKMEVDPLRDFVNNRLKALQDKFKSLTALKREQEAAGTKSKLLRNVNCISCDKDVVMRKEMDASLKPKAYAMPPSRSMAPYLAYELDQLRKQQKCVPGSKNLNFIENALKTRGAHSKEKTHICNRYCGGSHTVTTPQQRVTRLGHFLEQWGPEIAPLQDEFVKGKDNHMYKARDERLYSKKPSKKSADVSGIGKNVTPIVEAEVPQHDPETFVDPAVQEAISQEAKADSEDFEGKKLHNIGSVGNAPSSPSPPPAQSPRASRKPSEEPRKLSSEPRKPSIEPRKPSMEPRSSTMEPRSSTMEPRSSTMEPRSSTMEPRSSTMEPRSSTMEPRSSTMEPRKPSMEPRKLSKEPRKPSTEAQLQPGEKVPSGSSMQAKTSPTQRG